MRGTDLFQLALELLPPRLVRAASFDAEMKRLHIEIAFARELDAIIAWRRRPSGCVSDNGAELTSMAILKWSKGMLGVAWH